MGGVVLIPPYSNTSQSEAVWFASDSFQAVKKTSITAKRLS